VEIGEHAVVGAGSVVTKSIPACSLAVGNPAKVVKTFELVD
jgi:maltose O-acetyltransferase